MFEFHYEGFNSGMSLEKNSFFRETEYIIQKLFFCVTRGYVFKYKEESIKVSRNGSQLAWTFEFRGDLMFEFTPALLFNYHLHFRFIVVRSAWEDIKRRETLVNFLREWMTNQLLKSKLELKCLLPFNLFIDFHFKWLPILVVAGNNRRTLGAFQLDFDWNFWKLTEKNRGLSEQITRVFKGCHAKVE